RASGAAFESSAICRTRSSRCLSRSDCRRRRRRSTRAKCENIRDMARTRMRPGQLEKAFQRRWTDAATPPWGTLAADPVERAKARLLHAQIGDVRSVLDCGCGGGDFLALIDPDRRFERVVGIDV